MRKISQNFHEIQLDIDIEFIYSIFLVIRNSKVNFNMDVLVYSILCCLLFIPLWRFVRRPKVRLPPGPKGKLLIGVATDLNPKTAHLTLAKWAETHGALYSFRVFGLTSVVISDVRLIRKAYSSEAFQGVLNDRPETFVGKYLAYNYSDVGFAKYHDATVKLRKCLHKALHFYGDGVKKFEKLFTSELEKIVDEFQKSSANLVDPREVLEHSFCRLVFTLVNVLSFIMYNYRI